MNLSKFSRLFGRIVAPHLVVLRRYRLAFIVSCR